MLLNLLKEPTTGPDFSATNNEGNQPTCTDRYATRPFSVEDALDSTCAPPHGLRDFGSSFVLSIALDSAFCFAILSGLYLLLVRRSNGRKNDPS